MNTAQFIDKWQQVQLTERSAAQQHFLDLCALVGHPPPAEFDPTGDSFTFERGAAKQDGGDGWADVWKRGFFGWEYKGPGKDLVTAYNQLLQYREALENPPLLVVCDMERIVIHTNFTAVANQVHEIPLAKMDEPRHREILEAVFFEPEKLKPGRTSEAITQEAASAFAGIATSLRARGVAPDVSAHFLDRVVFCLFAEDIGLLPEELFDRIVRAGVARPADFPDMASELFRAMSEGKPFGADIIRHFNGALFENATALELTREELRQILAVTSLDWSAVDVSILGTLFERSMDPAKRAQLGAHYTSRQDIELLIAPVIMQPLRAEWNTVRDTISRRLAAAQNSKNKKGALRNAREEGYSIVARFLQMLSHVKVLDPACGSGNFLYVTLQKLKDLEKEVTLFAMDNGLGAFLPAVGPWQLYGIEVNPYAYDLALMTVWIGYLQWVKANGFGFPNDPILHKLEGNFRKMDAILDLTDPSQPKEPEWPRVDFMVGNPPFLGGNRIRQELGNDYVDALFQHYAGRVPAFADLCCYWFERARQHIADGKCKRAGLLATQGIRGGVNRDVLKRIKETGDIFWAVSDREWILDGASVHVSMVAFDDGSQQERRRDGEIVSKVNADLTSREDMTQALALTANLSLCFMGPSAKAPFDIESNTALRMLTAGGNPHGRPNSDVIRPVASAVDLARGSRQIWTIDFGLLSAAQAVAYEAPFEYVKEHVYPIRSQNRRASYAEKWWQYAEARPGMRQALTSKLQFIATPAIAKHRIFTWVQPVVLCNQGTFVFARSDDYFFGVLHSRFHQVWALKQGTRLETRPRYTPTTCFETFPFPWAPGKEPVDEPRVHAIAAAARELCERRDRWLNPPEWTQTEYLEFPATRGGIWDRYIAPYAPGSAPAATPAVADAPPSTPWGGVRDEQERQRLNQERAAQQVQTAGLSAATVGLARYPRLVPRDADCAQRLAKRTLTNLYNQQPEWLIQAHRKLDAAVAAAYGWPVDLADAPMLANLLALNLARSGS